MQLVSRLQGICWNILATFYTVNRVSASATEVRSSRYLYNKQGGLADLLKCFHDLSGFDLIGGVVVAPYKIAFTDHLNWYAVYGRARRKALVDYDQARPHVSVATSYKCLD